MKTAQRQEEQLRRFRGEEFIVLLPECTRAAGLITAERIRVPVGAVHPRRMTRARQGKPGEDLCNPGEAARQPSWPQANAIDSPPLLA